MKRVLISAALLFAPAFAAADAPESVHVDYGARSRMTATLGLFAPNGALGVEYAHVVHPNLEIAAGAGLGFSGPQVAVMPRLRAGNEHVSFSFGTGLSGGPLKLPELLCEGDDLCMDSKTNALWANAEVGLQLTSRAGATLRLFAGAGRVIAHDECTGSQCGDVADLVLPYGGLALGHTF